MADHGNALHQSTEDNGPALGESTGAFVQLLTGAQLGLFRYISALCGDPDEAGNILQETNLVLWRKLDDFAPESNFMAWAKSVALWQVKAWLRDRGRDRHVFSQELVSQLAQRPMALTDLEPRRLALRQCVQKLNSGDRELLQERYVANATISDMANRLKKSPTAVKSGLFRVRRALRVCIERRTAGCA